jgi:DNA-binding transcriptional LysR family regulator
MIARFMAECPDVEVHLDSTPRRVDVIAEGIDIALRVRFPPLEDNDLVMRVLADSTQRLVASPALLQELRRPPLPADLSQLPSIGWGPPHQPHEWCLDGPDEATALIPYTPRLITEDMVALRFAALKGIGVGQFPTMVIKADLDSGALVDVLPQWRPRAGIVHAVFSSRRGLLPSVRALLDFLAAEFAAITESESGVSTRGKMR